MNANEIVEALREECEDCSEFSPTDKKCHGILYCPTRYAASLIESQAAKIASLRAERDKAVADMKVMAIAMRESEELSEGCCFACIYDAQNLPDNVMLAYGECPGYDRDDCFDWCGTEGKA